MRYITKLFQSDYCKFAFLLFIVLSYFLVPRHVFYGWYQVLAIIFMLSFSLVMTCIVRNIKEEIVLARTYKSSILGVLATALGLSALQVCGAGAPVCGASLGIGVLSSITPTFFMNFLEKYSVLMLLIAISFQFLTLYFMNCFKDQDIKEKRISNRKQFLLYKPE